MQEEPVYHSVTVGTLFADHEIHFSVPEQCTVSELKQMLQQKINVPTCRQRLISKDRKKDLSDDASVVPRNAELELRVELAGGCGKECCGCTWYGPCVKRDCGDFEIFFPCSIM